MTSLASCGLFLGGVLVVVVVGELRGSGAREGEAEQQERDKAENGEKDEDDHGAADAVPKAELALVLRRGVVRKEIQVEIQRDEERQQADDYAGHAADRTNYALWEFVVDEHLLEEYQIVGGVGHDGQHLTALMRSSVIGVLTTLHLRLCESRYNSDRPEENPKHSGQAEEHPWKFGIIANVRLDRCQQSKRSH
jgi:hypothetical protein